MFEKAHPNLPLRGRWHDEVVTEGVTARRRWKELHDEVATEEVPPQAVEGVPRSHSPQIPFKSPNVFMAYVAMPQAAASPRPALSKPPATAA